MSSYIKLFSNSTLLTLVGLFIGLLETQAQAIPYKEEITLNVSARIVANSPIDIITIQNMNIQGVNPGDNQIYISPITSANAGLLQINAEPFSSVKIKYLLEEELLDETGTNTISVRYELSINTLRDQLSSTPVFVGEIDLQFDENGTYFIWLGGLIDLSNAESGRFSGQFTFEIEYI